MFSGRVLMQHAIDYCVYYDISNAAQLQLITGEVIGVSYPRTFYRIGKLFAQRIERHNLNLCTHIKRLARKKICFPKSAEIHQNVIGTYIERYLLY